MPKSRSQSTDVLPRQTGTRPSFGGPNGGAVSSGGKPVSPLVPLPPLPDKIPPSKKPVPK
jgi:hypothetical protein